MSVRIEKATHQQAHLIVLRKEDEQEAADWVPGLGPNMALSASIGSATSAASALDGDDVVCIFGHYADASEVHPWLMCSDLVVKHRKAFLRGAKDYVASLLAKYPGRLLCNYSSKGNTQARRLLEHLGFRFVPAPGLSKFDFFYHPASCA